MRTCHMRENHVYPPTSGRNIKFEGYNFVILMNFSEQEQNEYKQFLKITRNFAKKKLFFALKRHFHQLTQFSKTFITPQQRHNFKGGKQRFANTKFCVSKMKDFWKFFEAKSDPLWVHSISKTLECPKTTICTRLKIVASKLKDFDVFWGEIRPTLDFTQFSKTAKCPKTTRFQRQKTVLGKLKIICIENEGFSKISEAKIDPPLSGYEFFHSQKFTAKHRCQKKCATKM